MALCADNADVIPSVTFGKRPAGSKLERPSVALNVRDAGVDAERGGNDGPTGPGLLIDNQNASGRVEDSPISGKAHGTVEGADAVECADVVWAEREVE